MTFKKGGILTYTPLNKKKINLKKNADVLFYKVKI